MPKVLSGVDTAGTTDTGLGFRHGAGKPNWTVGAGSPEGVVTAVVGSLWSSTDGGTNTTLWRKETGTGNTGWVATTAAPTGGPFVKISGDNMTGNLGFGVPTPTAKLAFAASTATAGGIDFGGDTNLYRAAADTLRTDDSLVIGSSLTVLGTAVALGTNPATSGQLRLPNNTFIFGRNAANTGNVAMIAVNTADYVQLSSAGGSVSQGVAIASMAGRTLWVGHDANSTAPAGGLTFGSSADTNLYRSAADTLTTDDAFQATDYRLASAKYASIGSTANRSLLPFMQGTWADRFQHATISACEYWNGSAWTALASSTVQEAFSGHPSSVVTLNPTTYPKWRVTFSGVSASYAAMLFLYQEYSAGNPQGYKVTLEDSTDGSTFTTLLAETTVAAANYYATIPTTISYNSYIRLTIEHTSTTNNYNWRQIRFFSDRMNGQGGQQLGLPFTWNYAKQVTLQGGIGPWLALGTNPAQSGILRLPNLQNIMWRNAANTADACYISCDAGDSAVYSTPSWHRFFVSGAETFTIRPNIVLLSEGVNAQLGTTTGTKWGTNVLQKQGWWNATPVVQNTGWAVTAGYTADKAFNPATTTLAEVANVLGTLVDTLKTYGILG